jgi:hypothetical protein
LAPIDLDPRVGRLSTDAVSPEVADDLSMSLSELNRAPAVGRQLTFNIEELETAQAARADSIAAVTQLRLQSIAYDDRAGSEPTRAFAKLFEILSGLTQHLSNRATRDVVLLDVDIEFRRAAIAYLERRQGAIIQASAEQSPGWDVGELQDEIARDRALLDLEASITEQVENDARAAEQRAQEELARAQQARDQRLDSIAAQWADIAPELGHIAEERRIEEAQLAVLTRRREEFLRQQAEIGARISAISEADNTDVTRPQRADRLYDELVELRWTARDRVALLRREMTDRSARIERLDREVGTAIGRLDLTRSDPNLDSDEQLRASLVELRDSQVQLSEQRLGLERLHQGLEENAWRLTERQVYFFALSTDALVDYLGSARRDRTFSFTERNLFEAQHNFRDRLIGLSLMFRDRMEKFDELTSWLSSLDGVLWLSKLAFLLFIIVFIHRLLKRYRDRIIVEGILRRLEGYKWVQQHIRGVIKLAELIRASVTPVMAYTAILVMFGRFDQDLPEFLLVESVLCKLIILTGLLSWNKVLLLPQSVRVNKSQSVAPFAVDLFSMTPKSAQLLVLTVRLWLLYTIVASIILGAFEFLFGRGFTSHLFEQIVFWGQLLVVNVLCWVWRNEIVDGFLRLTGNDSGRAATLLRRYRDRIYTVIILFFLAVYVLTVMAYRFARNKLLPSATVRRLETFLFRKRIEMAKGVSTEVPALVEHSNGLPKEYLDLLSPRALANGELVVSRSRELRQITEIYEAWQAGGQGGAVATTGESGVGQTTLLDQLASRLPGSLPVVRHSFVSRTTSPKLTLRLLCELFDLGPFDNQDDLVDAITQGERRIALIDDVHYLYLRSIHGFDALETFLNVVSLTSGRVFWVLTFNLFAWDYVNRVYDREHHFRQVIPIKGLDDEKIRRMIELRNARGGILPSFGQLLVSSPRSRSSFYEVVKTAAGYYRLVADQAKGNPAVALQYWRQSLVPKPTGQVDVVLFHPASDEPLKKLSERQRFGLTAIAQHGSLSCDEIARVIAVDPGLCELDVNFLCDAGIVRIDKNEQVWLTIAYFRPVIAHLKSSNLLYLQA